MSVFKTRTSRFIKPFTDFDSSSEQNGKNMEIGDIDEYISIYSGLREHNGFSWERIVTVKH